MVCLGAELYLGDWTLGCDGFNNSGYYDTDEEYRMAKGNTSLIRVQYAPSERFDVQLRAMLVGKDKQGLLSPWQKYAAIAQFYPLNDSQDLRLHTSMGYDTLLNSFSLMVGAKYEFSLKLW